MSGCSVPATAVRLPRHRPLAVLLTLLLCLTTQSSRATASETDPAIPSKTAHLIQGLTKVLLAMKTFSRPRIEGLLAVRFTSDAEDSAGLDLQGVPRRGPFDLATLTRSEAAAPDEWRLALRVRQDIAIPFSSFDESFFDGKPPLTELLGPYEYRLGGPDRVIASLTFDQETDRLTWLAVSWFPSFAVAGVSDDPARNASAVARLLEQLLNAPSLTEGTIQRSLGVTFTPSRRGDGRDIARWARITQGPLDQATLLDFNSPSDRYRSGVDLSVRTGLRIPRSAFGQRFRDARHTRDHHLRDETYHFQGANGAIGFATFDNRLDTLTEIAIRWNPRQSTP